MDSQIINELIKPWTAHWSEEFNRYYYFNPDQNESVWELSKEKQQILDDFQKQYEIEKQNEQKNEQQDDGQSVKLADQQQKEADSQQNEEELQPNMRKFVPTSDQLKLYHKELVQFMLRPARKQVEQSLSSKIAYRQGDEEYNIWYDKFTTDQRQFVKERTAAQTRLDPELDTGFTNGDLQYKNSAYFCLHFAKGCCCEGTFCKFYHRVPSFQECVSIDQSRDIFGRPRHAKLRDDLTGIGSFLIETRTIHITEFKIIQTAEGLHAMYEILNRHFCMYGEIEDIIIKQVQGSAFIRFQHRCMAEFAKEAMQYQSLDKSEILCIKWAQDIDQDEQSKLLKQKEEQNMVKKAIERGQREVTKNQINKIAQNQRERSNQGKEEKLKDYQIEKIQELEKLKKKKIEDNSIVQQNISKLDQILKRIDQQK